MKDKITDPIEDNKNPLTPDEAARIADRLAGSKYESAALVMLLCFSLAYEHDASARDAMYGEIERCVAPLLEGFSVMLKTQLRGTLETLRGEGGAS